MTKKCVIVPVKRRNYKSLFRYLDRIAPDWWLGYRSDTHEDTQYLMGLIEELDIEEPAPLIDYMRKMFYTKTEGKTIDRLPIFVTPEQGVIIMLFWEGATPFNP
jgi:hypothetical protein